MNAEQAAELAWFMALEALDAQAELAHNELDSAMARGERIHRSIDSKAKREFDIKSDAIERHRQRLIAAAAADGVDLTQPYQPNSMTPLAIDSPGTHDRPGVSSNGDDA